MRYTPAQQIVRKISKLKSIGLDETSDKIIALNVELEKLRSIYFSAKKKIQTYPVKYSSYNKNDSNVIDITEIFSLIKSKEIYYGYYTTHRYRSKFMRNSYTPCGLFYGTNSIRKLNSILLFQLKGKPLQRSDIQFIKSNNYTFATYYEFEEKTTNILVKVEDLSSSNMDTYLELIKNHYHKKLKHLKIIIPLLTTSIPLTHDSALFYNENSEVFKI